MRCPQCKERVMRVGPVSVALLTKRLVIRKSDGAVTIICHKCGTPIAPSPEVSDALRTAVFLQVNH